MEPGERRAVHQVVCVMFSTEPSPARKDLVPEAGTTLPPRAPASALRLRLVLLHVPEGSQAFYHPL